MKLTQLIKELQALSDKHGDPEVAFMDHMDWRQHKSSLSAFDSGFVEVVETGYGYAPMDVVLTDRGYEESYRKELLQKPVKKVLLVGFR